jgi:hypothetical protein
MKSRNGGRGHGGTDRGPARGGGRKKGRSHAGRNGAGPDGSSRLLLTQILHESAIWNVYIATTVRSGSPTLIQLQFERRAAGQNEVRYTRSAEGALLEALHSGRSLSRAELEQVLELAVREAEGGAVGSTDVA